jgi:hypothetical protein
MKIRSSVSELLHADRRDEAKRFFFSNVIVLHLVKPLVFSQVDHTFPSLSLSEPFESQTVLPLISFNTFESDQTELQK